MTSASLLFTLRTILAVVSIMLGTFSLAAATIAIVAGILALCLGARFRHLEPGIARAVVVLALLGIALSALSLYLAPPGLR